MDGVAMPWCEGITHGRSQRAILCMLKTNPHDHFLFKVYLDELERLAVAAGFEIVDRIVQTRLKPKSNFLIGRGKVEELKKLVKLHRAGHVIFYNSLSSRQKLAISNVLECDVLDRYELTLLIFDASAGDKVSKLQIEYARLRKLAPFLKLQASLKYRREHPFFRSMGEYAFHSELNAIKKREKRIRQEIDRLAWEKLQQIKRRSKLGIPTVVLSGMYNAGKSSLFNVLCGENRPVCDFPFTTLSSKYQLNGLSSQKIFFVDTIGFVLDLDPMLIDSFKLNLLDLKTADLVVLVVGLDNPSDIVYLKLKESLAILKEIGVSESRMVVALNKADLLDSNGKLQLTFLLSPLLNHFKWTFTSAKKKDVSSLLSIIEEKLHELRVAHSLEGAPYIR
nr:HflX family GTPase [Candidatus Bathyarchaeota archaeon]